MLVPPSPRFKAAVAVYALLRREGAVLLVRRTGSGLHDGELALPAGHVEAGEDALSAVVREVAEELGIIVDRADCRLVLTGHSAPERPGDDAYVDLFFSVDHWTGEPRNAEPERCTELRWADPDALPAEVVPFMADAIRAESDPEASRLLLWHWHPEPEGTAR